MLGVCCVVVLVWQCGQVLCAESSAVTEQGTRLPPEPDTEGVFWQITDIHWDQQYSQDGDPTKMCHATYHTLTRTGTYGNYLCDSPWPLVKSAIQTMTSINNQPQFVLWTGDNVPHTDDPEPDFTVIFRTVSNITEELRTSFPSAVPIIPVLGNHDAFPKDNFPVAGEEFYGQYLTKGSWSTLLPASAQNSFKKGGYYAYPIPSGPTVLVLNTNLYYANNRLGVNASDPCGQFAWLRTQLQAAQHSGSKVIVAAHAPPGFFERFASVPFFNATYNDAYVSLLNEFGSSIMAQVYGHEHTDSFKLFTDQQGKVQSVGFLAPSVTPWYPAPVPGGTAINPSLRIYRYTSSTLLDYAQYHLNLTKYSLPHPPLEEWGNTSPAPQQIEGANRASHSLVRSLVVDPEWELFYQAREAFQLTSLDAASMAQLYDRLKSDDSLFQKYYLINSAGFNNGVCDAVCKKNQLCAIGNVKITDVYLCMKRNLSLDHQEHLVHVKVPIKEGQPVNFHYPSLFSGRSSIIGVLLTLSMCITVVLVVALAVLLVIIVVRRSHMLASESGTALTELSCKGKKQKYTRLP